MATVTYHGTSVCAVARIVSRNTDLARRVWQRSLPSGPVYCVHRGRSAPLVVGGYGGDRRPQRVQAWDGYWGRVACDAQYGLPRIPIPRTPVHRLRRTPTAGVRSKISIVSVAFSSHCHAN